MPRFQAALAASAAFLVASPVASSSSAPDLSDIWGRICSATGAPDTEAPLPAAQPASCKPAPNTFQSLASIGAVADTTANLAVGYDADAHRLCFIATGLPQAPVLRVGVGRHLSIRVTNTLQDTGRYHDDNCPIDTFGGEGFCTAKRQFAELPGTDGTFYKLMANQAHLADGTTNLHVHGLFVSPASCSDEVLKSAIYPANWGGTLDPRPACQSASNTLAYTYKLPADHPAGLYWYHTHRHGQSEHQTQMGLTGAIVVEDQGDAYRRSIGVTDEVLLVTDTAKTGCLVGVTCDRPVHGTTPRQADAPAARAAAQARSAAGLHPAAVPAFDPRVDQVDQAGECAQGASDSSGGTELWTLLLNGAPVPETLNGFPDDSVLLAKTMQPGQRQIFRLVNASANSFLAPTLVASTGGKLATVPLEVFARDGVGVADVDGQRHFGHVNLGSAPFVLPPSGRVEFVVHAPPAGTTLYLQSNQVNPGCGGNAYPARRLLRITSSGAPVDPGAADDSDLLRNTPSLLPYLSTLGQTASVHRTFVLAEYGRGFTYGVAKWLSGPPSVSDYDPSQTDFYITQIAADDGETDPANTAMIPFSAHNLAPQVVVHLHGRKSVTEDWLIENSTLEIHAFHIHQVHFRDVTLPGTDVDTHPLLDVITVPAAPLVGDIASGTPGRPGVVRVRMTFTTADIGEFVFHCHILEHEDNGMMGKIRVVAN